MAPVRRVAGALALALVACSGGGSDAEDRDARPGPVEEAPADEATEGVAPPASVEELFVGGHLASAEIDIGDFTVTYEATVAAPDRYHASFGGLGPTGEYVRIGQDLYTRTGSGADRGLFTVAPLEESLARGALLVLAQDPDGADFADDGVVVSIVLEALLLDPVSVLDPRSVTPGRTDVDLQLPDDIAAALATLGVDVPSHEIVTHRSGKRVDSIDLRFDLEDAGTVEGVVRYNSWGEVDPEEIVEPSPEEVDATPFLDEETLAAFTDAPLLAPTVLPDGVRLAVALVLSPEETVESCLQVELDYVDIDDPDGGRSFTLFLLPAACATDFDPGPFDELLGGRPARGDGYEVLVEATVVQVARSEGVTPEEIDAMVASLAPVTAADLVAAVSATNAGG